MPYEKHKEFYPYDIEDIKNALLIAMCEKLAVICKNFVKINQFPDQFLPMRKKVMTTSPSFTNQCKQAALATLTRP
jgi:hypothetical protein